MHGSLIKMFGLSRTIWAEIHILIKWGIIIIIIIIIEWKIKYLRLLLTEFESCTVS